MEPTRINVSTAFFPSAILPGVAPGERCDLIIQSSDSVFFYGHKDFLRSKSSNEFASLLRDVQVYYEPPRGHRPLLHRSNSEGPSTAVAPRPSLSRSLSSSQSNSPAAIYVEESSGIFNILLHVTYGISLQKYGPGIDLLAGALTAMVKYGLPVPEPGSEVWTLLLRQAGLDPIRVYCLGALYGIESVCIAASEHTLQVSLSSLTESQAVEMGPLYLRRLFFLHLGRTEALKRVLGTRLEDHTETASCSVEARADLQNSWKAARAELLSNNRPQNISEADMVSVFGPLSGSTRCLRCKEIVQQRAREVVHDWNRIKRTI